MTRTTRRIFALSFAGLVAAVAGAPAAAVANPVLAGTAWSLDRIESGGGEVLRPDVPSKYTLQFAPDGRLFARIDCNRGNGSWTSADGSSLGIGIMALTRAMCPPGSLHDRILRDLPLVRSFKVTDGHLRLSLEGNQAHYVFAATEPQPTGPKK